jgi:hypothetical protein
MCLVLLAESCELQANKSMAVLLDTGGWGAASAAEDPLDSLRCGFDYNAAAGFAPPLVGSGAIPALYMCAFMTRRATAQGE